MLLPFRKISNPISNQIKALAVCVKNPNALKTTVIALSRRLNAGKDVVV